MSGAGDATSGSLGFVHRYVPSTVASPAADGTTLLLLHGTGGDEHDLLPLGRTLLPGAAMLSPRGKVLEGGAPRFFRRLAPGVFDLVDLARRTSELAEFIDNAATSYQLQRDQFVAVGFSNGANIAASLLLTMGGAVSGAVLLSPMLPFTPESLPDLTDIPVFIGAGERDPMASRDQVEQLTNLLRQAGASVTLHWTPGGHTITKDEIIAAQEWMLARNTT